MCRIAHLHRKSTLARPKHRERACCSCCRCNSRHCRPRYKPTDWRPHCSGIVDENVEWVRLKSVVGSSQHDIVALTSCTLLNSRGCWVLAISRAAQGNLVGPAADDPGRALRCAVCISWRQHGLSRVLPARGGATEIE